MSRAAFSATEWNALPPSSPDRSGEAFLAEDICPSPQVSFHVAGARGVLFDARRQRLYALNRSGSFLWCCLAEGYTPVQTARAYAMHSRIPETEAGQQVAAALRAWIPIGLITALNPAAGRIDLSPSDSDAFIQPGAAATADSFEATGHQQSDEMILCQILDTRIAVFCADRSLFNAVAPVLAGMNRGNRHPAGTRLDVIHAYRGRVALIHGGAARWIGPRSRLAPTVVTTLIRLALEQSENFPAIHAAAVQGKYGAVLFPGPSGSGKSLLAAAMLAAKHRVLCDDTVVLDMNSMRARPVAPIISLKSDAWHAVEDRLPRTRRLPAYQRPDGALVRFLTLDRTHGDQNETRARGLGVHALVFPRYRPDRTTRLRRIGTVAALGRLLPCIDPIGHRLEAEHVHRLIQWVGATDCYDLSLNELDSATAAVGHLLT